jgi:hypothetical protein
VTYINHIVLPDNADARSSLERIFRFWSNTYHDDQNREVEDATIQFRYRLLDEDGKPRGRLYAVIQPTTPAGVQFQLIARGRPKEESLASALDYLGDCRDAVVRAFASMTRPEMHKLWGLKDA